MNALQVVSEPSRNRILQLVWSRERAASEIAGEFSSTFGAVSQHLRLLREHDFVEVRRDGRHRFYRANRKRLGVLGQVLEQMWSSKLSALKGLVETETGRRE